jgi:hypothetical protein
MEILTAEIIKNQLIGQYSGHMSAIPNNPFIFGMVEAYMRLNNEINMDYAFKQFISELNEALKET